MTAPLDDVDAIAIVGAGCRLPGAPDLASFWRNLRAGSDTLTRFAAEQLIAAGVPADVVHDKDFVPVAGVLPDGDCFDWRYFGYSLAEARMIDPQQRIFLEVCLAALQDAGIDPRRFPGWIGVYGGCDAYIPAGEGDLLSQVLASDKDFLATRVAYKLGLRGPAITVQTACSTSLVAVHQACQSLRNYECDAALAGGSSLGLPQIGGYLYQEGHVHSTDGRCRSYDAAASGTVPSNGAGAVVLRRLADALADGDRVMAVIRGSAVNNDGGEKIGYTAPSLSGQRDVIKLALGQAEVDPAELVHVEGHGTATPVGDPIEVAALTAAFRAFTDKVGYCWLGSAKSNIGHTSATAGVAGLIKTALMLEHGELVPTVNFDTPNPHLELDSSPFKVITGNQRLPTGRPALAAVSSFGIGGTNAHAVVQGPPAPVRGSGPRVFCLSAPSADALLRAREQLAEHITENPPDPVAAAWTLLNGRAAHTHRVSVVAENTDHAAAELRDDVRRPASTADSPAQVAFVFPGHGTLYPGAAAAAYARLPVFRGLFDEATELARRNWNIDLSVAVRAEATEAETHASMVQQIGGFAVGYALGAQLLDWDIQPTAMLGQSLGEYVAAALAGLWDLPTGLELVAERALAIETVPAGRMLAVYAEASEVRDLLDGDIAIATDGPGQLVLAGSVGGIERVAGELTGRGIDNTLLVAPAAGHTEQMRPVGTAVSKALARLPLGSADLPVVSNLTGRIADPEQLADPEYWSAQMCGTVQLSEGMSTLLGSGATTVIELGPGQSMVGGLRRHPGWTDQLTGVPLLGRPAQPREATLLGALGTLWQAGLPVDWEPLFTARPSKCSLPPMPLDSEPMAVNRPKKKAPRRPAPFKGDELARLWCTTLGVATANPEDNFFTLGGESLGLVQLLGTVRRQTGVRVTVAELAREPTYGALVRLTSQPGDVSTGYESPNLLLLQDGGPRAPLFLCASGTGSTLCYQQLAPLLGDEQPVYGFEAPGLHDGAVPLNRFEDMAVANIALLRSVQPVGPYRIGGWSLGAMIAHEMASQLLGQGERVETLLCIDGFLPSTRVGRDLPVGVRPGYLLGGLRLRAKGGHLGAILDLQKKGGAEYERVFHANIRALLRYVPRPVDASAVIFKTGLAEKTRRKVLREVSPLYRGGVRIVGVPGDHWSVLDRAGADVLAREMRTVMDENTGGNS